MKIAKISFCIQHLDQFGQGVHKENGNIYFIPQTLPGEEGKAQVVASRKGVNFCKLIKITTPSPHRETSPCPHYAQCSGCHYLHTSYEFELEQKLSQFKRQLASCGFEQKITPVAATERFHYRNRMQLHYDRRTSQLGMIASSKDEILPIPSCLLPSNDVKQAIDGLYKNKSWITASSQGPTEGHLEIYQQNNAVKLSYNERYAAGGFTQINQSQNKKCLEIFSTIYKDILPTDRKVNILDLFGGDGNLTRELENHHITVVDSGPIRNMQHQNQHYVQLDIYGKKALKSLESQVKAAEIIVLDPPRSGLKNIAEVVQLFRPETIVYLSCNPSTLIRDIENLLDEYQIDAAYLLDFFPSTFHWESLVILKRK